MALAHGCVPEPKAGPCPHKGSATLAGQTGRKVRNRQMQENEQTCQTLCLQRVKATTPMRGEQTQKSLSHCLGPGEADPSDPRVPDGVVQTPRATARLPKPPLQRTCQTSRINLGLFPELTEGLSHRRLSGGNAPL